MNEEPCIARFGPKVGQIGPKWEKSGTFSDQISVHFGALRQNVLKSDLKKFRIFLTHFVHNSDIRGVYRCLSGLSF